MTDPCFHCYSDDNKKNACNGGGNNGYDREKRFRVNKISYIVVTIDGYRGTDSKNQMF